MVSDITMNEFLKTNFIYLSQIINLPVVNLSDNKKLGRIVDAVAILRDAYPKISAFILKKGPFKKPYYLNLNYVKKIIEDEVVFVDNMPQNFEEKYQLAETEVLLKDIFWDKQVVDISGAKLVRINDLNILKEDSNLWVVHIDIGFKGLLRRLGWLDFTDFVLKWLFSYEMKDRLVSWKVVQPLTTATTSESLHLKIPFTKLSELHPADLADILIDIGPEERVIILNSLDVSTAAKAMQELPLKIRIQVAELMNHHVLAKILNEMPMDEVVDIIAELPKKIPHSLFNILPKEKVLQIKELLEHSKHPAGSLMNTEFIAVKQNTTAGEVLNKLKTNFKKIESIYYIYAVDDSEALTGVITLRQILNTEPEKTLVEFMRKKVVKTRIDTDIKKIARLFYKYNFDVIPVTDKQNKIKGIITLKDTLETIFPEIKEEAEEKQ